MSRGLKSLQKHLSSLLFPFLAQPRSASISDSFTGPWGYPTDLVLSLLAEEGGHQRRIPAICLWLQGSPAAVEHVAELLFFLLISVHSTLSTSSTCHLCYLRTALRPVLVCQAPSPPFTGRANLAQVWPPGFSVTAHRIHERMSEWCQAFHSLFLSGQRCLLPGVLAEPAWTSRQCCEAAGARSWPAVPRGSPGTQLPEPCQAA